MSQTYNVIVVNNNDDGINPVQVTFDHIVQKGDEISVVDYCELTEPEESAVFEVVAIRHIIGENMNELCDPYMYVEMIEDYE